MAKKQSGTDEESMKIFREQYLNTTNHYCPECGDKCTVSSAEYGEDIEPQRLVLKCEKCGESVIDRKDGLYFYGEIPYIPGMENNSATLLYRRDPNTPLETEDDFFDYSGLLMDVSDGYRDNFNFEQHIDAERKIIDLVKESKKRGFKGLLQIASLSYSRLAQYYLESEETDDAKKVLLEGLEFVKELDAVGICAFLYMCLENDLLSIAKDEIIATYESLKNTDLDSIDKGSDDRFASAMFCNVLSGISEKLGSEEDALMLLKRSLDRYLELYDGSELDQEELDSICSVFYQNIINAEKEDAPEISERFVEFTDRFKEQEPLWSCTSRLRRYVAYSQLKDDGSHDDDLEYVISGLEGMDDIDSRYVRANALLFSSAKAKNKRDALRDISEAYGLIMKNLKEGDEAENVSMSIISTYLTEIKRADPKKYDASIKDLRDVGISKNDIKKWKENLTQ